MRILYINHYAGSPDHGMEYRPHYLARHWVRMGHEVMIVAASVSHLRYKNPVLSGDVAEQTIDGIRYLWLKTPAYSGNGIGRARNMARFVFSLCRHKTELIRQFSPHAVIASSTYTWDIFPAHAIARAVRAKLVYEVHDLWPLSPIELGGMSRWHPFIVSLQWGEDHACAHADLVVSMLPMAGTYLREHGMALEKFHYIPNGIELSEWQVAAEALPPEYRNQIAQWRRQDRFIVCYAGSHGISDDLDTFLDAAGILAAQPVEFVLVGQGPDKARLQRKARSAGLFNVHFLDPVQKPAIPELLRLMDCLYIGWKSHSLYRFGISPNKLMDYMATGKVIVTAGNAANDSVREAGCGYSVEAESPLAVADAVLRAMRLSPQERARMQEAGLTYVRTNHDYAVLAQKFASLMS